MALYSSINLIQSYKNKKPEDKFVNDYINNLITHKTTCICTRCNFNKFDEKMKKTIEEIKNGKDIR